MTRALGRTRLVPRVNLILIAALQMEACADEAAPAPYAVNAPANRDPDAGCTDCVQSANDEDGGKETPRSSRRKLPTIGAGSLGLPLVGAQNQDWALVAYVDADPMDGKVADYTSARGDTARTYDGHAGTDFAIASFRKMDEGVEVLAIADGTVIETQDGLFDRSTERLPGCNLPSNFVAIRHGSGVTLEYQHLRSGSVEFAVGDRVPVGDSVGLVGSSGCSGGPHLHLEVTNAEGQTVDPFAERLFRDPPEYDAPPGVMDVVLRAGGFLDSLELVHADRPSVSVIRAGDYLGFGAITAGAAPGDRMELRLIPPRGEPRATSHEYRQGEYYTVVYSVQNELIEGPIGRWNLRVFLNDLPMKDVPFTVE